MRAYCRAAAVILFIATLLCGCVSSPTAVDESLTEPQKEALAEEARALLLRDVEVIGIFARQSLAEYAKLPEEYGVGDYFQLKEDCPYYSFSAVEELLEQTYSAESEIAGRYLNGFPPYGVPSLRRGEDGGTEINLAFCSSFGPSPEIASIILLSRENESYCFQYSQGRYIYAVSAVKTAGGLRLADSLLFLNETAEKNAGRQRDSVREMAGSARALTGDCLVLNIFADDPENVWDDESRGGVTAMLQAAAGFIVSQAEKWGVSGLNIDFAELNIALSKNAPPGPEGSSWLDTQLEADGYGGVKDLLAEYSYIIGEAELWGENINVFAMFHFKKHGRSYSLPCERDRNDLPEYFERSVMFYSEKGEGEYFACPALYAHEMLHVFGAHDLYLERVGETAAALAALYFPDDIMGYVPENINAADIGAFTAKLIGWTDYLPENLRALIG